MTDINSGDKIIGANYEALFFVLDRYFHKQTTCMNSQGPCDRIADTHRLMTRNLEREEQLMLDAGYPDFDDHKHEHQQILRMLKRFQDTFVCSEYDNSIVSEFVLKWARQHAIAFDKPFCDFLHGYFEIGENGTDT